MQQKSKAKMWVDETGMEIPYSRTTKHERLSEKLTARVLNNALALNESLASFKEQVEEIATELYESFLEENDVDKIGKGKGNMTFYNFDRSVKLEVSVNEPITFDDNLIMLAKEKLDQFLKSKMGDLDSVIREFVIEAFATSRGKLDVKKILGLKRHASRLNDKGYDEAMSLIDKAIRRPDSKTYFRVWAKDEHGQYKSVDLNFSSI